MKRNLLAVAVLGLFPIAVLAQSPAAPAAPAGGNFDVWAKGLMGNNNSPVAAEPGDYQTHWTAPNGSKIQLTVKRPRPLASAPIVTLPAVPEGEDARPYFDKALEEVRAKGAKKLVIPTGKYTFKSLARGDAGQLVLQKLNDVTIDGGGSTFIFNLNKSGIHIDACKRMVLANINIEFGLKMAALGVVQEQGGENVLKIDPEYPVTAADTMGHMSEYDRTTKHTVPAGLRVYAPPGSKEVPKFIGDQTYTSPAFQNKNMVGKSFLVFQQWYGGAAVEIKESVGPQASEDITLSGINIYSGPGMGFITFGMKRGLEIVNCQVIPKPGALISTEYDAIHMMMIDGDISIHDNIIRGQGDDGINLNNMVTPVAKMEPNGKDVVLGTYSRFYQIHDKLSVFDDTNHYLGSTEVTDVPKSLGGPNNQWYGMTLSNAVPGMTLKSFIRNNNIVSGRVSVVHNLIGDCGCHGILVQVPNVLVQDNTFQNTSGNAIRMLANLSYFKEGTGAFNVLVKNNTITHSGIDGGVHAMKFAAIASYGNGREGVTDEPANQYIDVIGNTITAPQQGCITIASSQHVNILGNTCKDTNQNAASHHQPSIWVMKSDHVLLKDNVKIGDSTGPIFIDTETTKAVTGQESF